MEIDPHYIKPTEVELLLVDSSKARRELGWNPRIIFKELIRIIVDSNLELAELD